MKKTFYFLNNYYTVEPFFNPILNYGGVIVLMDLEDDMQRIIDYINDLHMPESEDIEGNKKFDEIVTNHIIDKLY